MFSPTLATSSVRAASTDRPSGNVADASAATSSTSPSRTSAATACANAAKFSSLATKSVSELTSTIAARLPSVAITTRPSAATRPDFFSALAWPAFRRYSTAASMSPPVSASAFLQSIMPAPVRSRSSFTCDALIGISLSRSNTVINRHRWRAAVASTRPRGAARGRPSSGRPRWVSAALARGAGRFRRRRAGAFLRRNARAGLRCRALGGLRQVLRLGIRHRRADAVLGGLDLAAFARRLVGVGLPPRRRLAGGACGLLRGLLLAPGRPARAALLVELDEVVLAELHLGQGGLAFLDRVRDQLGVQLDRAHRVVIAGDDVIDALRRA